MTERKEGQKATTDQAKQEHPSTLLQAVRDEIAGLRTDLRGYFEQLTEQLAAIQAQQTQPAPADTTSEEDEDDQSQQDDQDEERGDEAEQTWHVLPARPAGLQRNRPNSPHPEPIILTVQRPAGADQGVQP